MSLTRGALPKMSVNIPYTCVKIVNTGSLYVLIRLPPARLRDISKDGAAILYTLYRHTVFGKHHMVEDHLLRGFPPDQIATLRRALETLKREGTILRKSTKHGPAVYLPPKLGREIYERLKKHYPFLPKPAW